MVSKVVAMFAWALTAGAAPNAANRPAFRVCVECVQGPTTLRALRFMMPRDGPAVHACSCLARCDRGVAVQCPTGNIETLVNGPPVCANILRDIDQIVDQRLPTAYSAATRGTELAVAGREPEAIVAYNRAFSLSVAAGLGLSPDACCAWPIEVPAARPIAAPVGALQGDKRTRSVARLATCQQKVWLARVLLERSRVYSRLARQGQVSARRRSLEDAHYAVQLAESSIDVQCSPGEIGSTATHRQGLLVTEQTRSAFEIDKPHVELLTDLWENLAEAFELTRDIDGAISAYERLLALEPSTSPGLSSTMAAKRGFQEVVLLSHRRGLEDSQIIGRGLQSAANRSVATLMDRGLQDVEVVREVVKRDLDTVEQSVRARRPARLEQLILGNRATAKALDDLRVLRKIAAADSNRLQMAILRGDPLYAFLRDAWQRARGESLPPIALDPISAESEAVLWLRMQFDQGALPPDPQLVANLLEQAKRDPDLVTRLVAEAKDGKGRDLFTRLKEEGI